MNETYAVGTDDGIELRLTRVRGGTKGPVLLVHGAGVHSGMFALPTIDETFPAFLAKNGYDVWLLDWRASILLPLRQFTLDDAAQRDFPAAVNAVLSATGASSVQAVVHCAGAIAFFLSLASGALAGKVRCVSCSQVALHYKAPFWSELKSAIHLPDVMADASLAYLSATEDPAHPVFQSLFSDFVNVFHQECASTVCHRVTFLYGHLYRHENLNVATHERLDEQFGKCNMTAFRHLTQLLRRGTAARFDYGAAANVVKYGSEEPPSYLDATHLKIPITFVSGEKNQTFLPVSTERTYDWLCAENGAALYKRHVVPGYGHIDGFMGARANVDVFPLFLEQLEASPAT
jgi:pimeloyl-ACP methyl ester carboxylesterase